MEVSGSLGVFLFILLMIVIIISSIYRYQVMKYNVKAMSHNFNNPMGQAVPYAR